MSIVKDCRDAATTLRVMETFSTGRSILMEAANEIVRLQNRVKSLEKKIKK
jgi:hypothetical protein